VAAPLLPQDTWRLIEPILPARPRHPRGGRPPIGDREVLIGVLFVLKTGIAWEDLPEELGCGCGMTCLRRLRHWQRNGIWQQIEDILKRQVPGLDRLDWSRVWRWDNPRMKACSVLENTGDKT
jgi:transposase